MYYSVVGPDGYIVLSMITSDPNFSIEAGHRLLPDSPPDPRNGDYIPGQTRPVRLEPVPLDAASVPYAIVDELQSLIDNGDSSKDYVVTDAPEVNL